MGQAREIMDAITAAVMAGDADAIGVCYAADAVAETPDAGRIEGRDGIVAYLMTFATAFSDRTFEMREKLEVADIAVDEGFLIGRHTGTLRSPEADIAPTGRQLRMRSSDIATVRNGVVVSHRFYYDQIDFLAQLGLLDATQRTGAPPAQRADASGTAAPQHA